MITIKKATFYREGVVRNYEGDTLFEGLEFRYPLRGIKSCHYEVEITSLSSEPNLVARLTGIMTLEDTLDGTIFDRPFSLEEEALIMEKEDDEGSGYIFPGPSFVLEEVLLAIISSSLPLRVRKEEE